MTDFKIEFIRNFGSRSDDMEFLMSHHFYIKRSGLAPLELGWRPATDVFETAEEIVIIMDVAGIDEKDLSIILDNEVLIIRGVRRELTGFKKRHYHEMEIDFGPFERIVKLPSRVEEQKVRASYKNGFLEIRMFKSRLDNNKIQIQIN